jgi:hypothetical protein
MKSLIIVGYNVYYADNQRRPLKFKVEGQEFLKVAP